MVDLIYRNTRIHVQYVNHVQNKYVQWKPVASIQGSNSVVPRMFWGRIFVLIASQVHFNIG